LLLSIFGGICFLSQNYKSVTVDEFSHFPAGVYNIRTFDWRMDWESPPLIKCLPAISILYNHKAEIDPLVNHQNPWRFGYEFMYLNFNDYIDIFQAGRIIIIIIGCFGGILLYHFSCRIYGPKGGIFALFLYVFNPNIIAHSRLTTIDAGAMTMFLLAFYGFWKFLKNMNMKTASLAGICLGLAQISKFTALILYPIFLLIYFICLLRQIIEGKLERRKVLDQIALLFLMITTSILIINTGYLFSGSFFDLKNHTFVSDIIRNIAASPLNAIPVPLPIDYVKGFDVQLNIASGESPFYMGYLMGEYDMEGWWYYYFVALWVKNPEILWVVFFLSAIFWIRKTPDFEAALCIWVPMIVFVFYFSFFTRIPIGVRFLLPVFPLFFLAAGYLPAYLRRYRWKNMLVAIIGVLYAIPAIAVFPDYLSYFNITSGGPAQGRQWLIDSNLDWGQDLVALNSYMRENDIEKIKLGYFGRVDPRIYGIDYQLAPKEPGKGVTAISTNFLMGRPYYLLESNGREVNLIGFDHYKKYRRIVPDKILGNTIHVYRIE